MIGLLLLDWETRWRISGLASSNNWIIEIPKKRACKLNGADLSTNALIWIMKVVFFSLECANSRGQTAVSRTL